MESKSSVDGVEVVGQVSDEFSKILTPEALRLIKSLHTDLSDTRTMLLSRRADRQKAFDAGQLPDFPQGRDTFWQVGFTVTDIPRDLRDRRVEITGPAGDRKMMINALNSGANVYMADLEDSQSPTWEQVLQSQVNLRDAIDRTIRFTSHEGREYSLNEKTATLVVRPRGLHLPEEHVRVNGEPVSASIFDAALFVHENGRKLREKGTSPYFYVPKVESALEARFWERLFTKLEDYMVFPAETIKATVLIETLPAVFEMDQILYIMRNHVVALNPGRWDYIFSYIKKLRNSPAYVLPDRSQITMDKGFLAAYVDLLIQTCHRRGAYAIGGMSAYIPVKNDDRANSVALEKVRADKEREVRLGHDGTWVAHPGLVQVVKDVFDAGMKGVNQLSVKRDDVKVTRDDLLKPVQGEVTEAGLRSDIDVGLRYLESWLGGVGCVPINNLMEDAATAEITRSQLWQWARHRTSLSDGRKVTVPMLKQLLSEEATRLSATESLEAKERLAQAGALFESLVTAEDFPEFLTIAAYRVLLESEKNMKGRHRFRNRFNGPGVEGCFPMDRVGVLIVSKCLSATGIIDAFTRSGYDTDFYVVERQANPFILERSKVHLVVPDLNVAEVARFARKWKAKLSFGLTDTEDFIVASGRDTVEAQSGVPMLCVTGRYAVEGSKADQRTLFQELFKNANPRYAIFDPAQYRTESSAVAALRRFASDLKEPVIKPDAPTRGAGVGVWGQEFVDEDGMVSFFKNVYSKGRVVVEERLDGEESSFQALSDGKHFIVAPQTRDYKRALDGNEGKLTGGMGSYRDAARNLPFIRRSEWDSVVERERDAFRKWRGRGSNAGLRGFVLYDALMHTGHGFKILERNSRGGNTEQLCLFTTIDEDLVDVCFRMLDGTLKNIRFSKKASVVTCAVPRGYGVAGASAGEPERIDLRGAYAMQRRTEGLYVYPMDVVAREDGTFMGNSRTVAVVGVGDTLEDARTTSLAGVDALKGPLRSRRDVASKLDLARSVEHMKALRKR